MKKVFSIIIFFILLIPITSGNIENNSPRTLYVDDDNINGPWDGSIEHPFKEINDATAIANDGDTIFVFNGEYKSSIIYDEINLIGEDKENTIIRNDGISYSSLYLKSNFVTIKNFTICNGDYGIHIVDCSNIKIQDNIIIENDIGFSIYQSNKNIINNNLIKNNTKSGIAISNSKRNKIEYNEISNTSGDGIITFEIWSALITHNNFTNNKCGINIYEEKFTPLFLFQNNIVNNNFKDNNIHAGGHAAYVSIFHTRFIHNYWGQPRILPKIIYSLDRWGNFNPIPCNIDWFPSLSPINMDEDSR